MSDYEKLKQYMLELFTDSLKCEDLSNMKWFVDDFFALLSIDPEYDDLPDFIFNCEKCYDMHDGHCVSSDELMTQKDVEPQPKDTITPCCASFLEYYKLKPDAAD